MRQYQYKEERHPLHPDEVRLLVTWPGYGWWHKLGHVVDWRDGICDRGPVVRAEAWPAHGLHPDVSRPFNTHAEAVGWLRQLWEERQARRRVA
ncbi:MAG: hypothetical protein WC683_01865 [bacterium]